MTKEEEMFRALGYGPMIEQVVNAGHLHMIDLYDMAVKDCFEQDLRSKAVDSLRRTFSAIRNCTINRGTPEFYALIDLGSQRCVRIRRLENDRLSDQIRDVKRKFRYVPTSSDRQNLAIY